MTFLRVLSSLAAEATIRCAVHNNKKIRPGQIHKRALRTNRDTGLLYAPDKSSLTPLKIFFIPRCGDRPWASHKNFSQCFHALNYSACFGACDS